jgi:YVTN family beta-propeller protein
MVNLRACLPALAALMVPVAAQAGPELFVANKRANTITKIDLETGEVAAEATTCSNPHELAIDPGGVLLAVACYGGEEVVFHRTDDLAPFGETRLGDGARPHGIVWTDLGLFVTAEGRQSIFVLSHPRSAGIRSDEIATGQQGSHMIAVDADAHFAWTADMGSATATLIDLTSQQALKSVPLGREPEGIAITPDGKTLWVSARGSNEAFALDPATMEVRARVDTGRFPLRIAVRPQGDVAITSNLMDGSLSVIDLASNEITRTIVVSSVDEAQERFQVTILWSPDGERIYVAETGTDTIAEVDYASGMVLRRFAVGDGGDGLAIRP